MALAHMAEAGGQTPQLLLATLEINRTARQRFVCKLKQAVDTLDGATIAVWGLAFKPETDDLREAPAIEIIQALLDRGAHVRAYDPEAMEGARALLPNVTFCASPYDAARGADAIALITEWRQFKAVDMTRVRHLLRRPIFVDGRNVYDPAAMAILGFAYHGIGVQPAGPAARAGMAAGIRERDLPPAVHYDASLLVAAGD
jgi:UDPglucose 6-dehydrogenase